MPKKSVKINNDCYNILVGNYHLVTISSIDHFLCGSFDTVTYITMHVVLLIVIIHEQYDDHRKQ